MREDSVYALWHSLVRRSGGQSSSRGELDGRRLLVAHDSGWILQVRPTSGSHAPERGEVDCSSTKPSRATCFAIHEGDEEICIDNLRVVKDR